jgi:tetratricopeptide (TPR) repeat protein
MTDDSKNTRLDQLLKLRDADPADADLPYMIALEYVKAGDAEQALRWLDTTIAQDAHYHYAYFQKAKLLDDEGEGADALVTLDAGIALATEAGNAKALGELQELRQFLAGG